MMDVGAQIILETDRLILREMSQADFPDLCKILQDEEVMYAYEHAFSVAEVQEWLDRQLQRYREYGFGLWAALAVYQETGSLTDAGLAAWALGGPSIETHIDTREIPGNVTLSIGHLRRGRDANLSLRYREDGRWVQVGAIQHFADITLAAINAYRAGAL